MVVALPATVKNGQRSARRRARSANIMNSADPSRLGDEKSLPVKAQVLIAGDCIDPPREKMAG